MSFDWDSIPIDILANDPIFEEEFLASIEEIASLVPSDFPFNLEPELTSLDFNVNKEENFNLVGNSENSSSSHGNYEVSSFKGSNGNFVTENLNFLNENLNFLPESSKLPENLSFVSENSNFVTENSNLHENLSFPSSNSIFSHQNSTILPETSIYLPENLPEASHLNLQSIPVVFTSSDFLMSFPSENQLIDISNLPVEHQNLPETLPDSQFSSNLPQNHQIFITNTENLSTTSSTSSPNSTLSAIDENNMEIISNEIIPTNIEEIMSEDINEIINDDIFDNFEDLIKFPKKNSKEKKEIRRDFECELCRVKLPSMAYLKRHYRTKGHLRKEQKKNPTPMVKTPRFEELTQLSTDEIKFLHMIDEEILGSVVTTPNSTLNDSILNLDLPSEKTVTVKIAPPPSSVAKFYCHPCKKSFNQRCYFTQHNQTHHSGEKKFKCEKCGKKYSTEIELGNHVMKHSAMKPFKCGMCEKAYNNKVDLRRHEKNHEGQRPHLCGICSRGFVRRDHLEKHYKVHERKGQKQLMKAIGGF